MKDLIKGTLLLTGGIVLGATAALLLAPQTREETLQKLSDLAGEAKKRAQDFCDQVKQDLAQNEVQTPKTEENGE